MKNEMNKIPTPETDAAEMCVKHTHRMLYDEDKVVDAENARDLERRLTIAREALQSVSTYPIAREHNDGPCLDRRDMLEVCRALALTRPAPKP